MSEIILRPYQKKFIDDVRYQFTHKKKHVCGVAPCGAGKTIMTGWMIREAATKGKRSIFFVHRKELIDQTAKAFIDLGIKFGIIAAGYPFNPNIPVQIASVQTLVRRLDKIPAPDFLICDECHHIIADSYKKIVKAFPNAFLLGVTATPQRMGGKGLGDMFDVIVESLSVDELINLGNLTDFKYVANDDEIDLSAVRVIGGDYVSSDLQFVMSTKKIIGGIVDNYLKFARGKQAICYCVNVFHSHTIAQAFNNAGISAAHIDGETEKHLRARLVNKFREGKIKVLCNAELFGEGFDVPNCQTVILARPTKSLTLYIQQSMRAMRPDPNDSNKIAIIIDHVKNYKRNGFPNDEHNWSLEDKPKPKIKCPHCGKLIDPESDFKRDENGEPITDEDGKFIKIKICPLCGQELPKSILKPGYHEPDTTEHDGTLTEIMDSVTVRTARTPEQFMYLAKKFNRPPSWAATKASRFAKTIEDFIHIADVVGRKHAWAAYQMVPRVDTYDELVRIATVAGIKKPRGWAWYRWQEKNSAQTC